MLDGFFEYDMKNALCGLWNANITIKTIEELDVTNSKCCCIVPVKIPTFVTNTKNNSASYLCSYSEDSCNKYAYSYFVYRVTNSELDETVYDLFSDLGLPSQSTLLRNIYSIHMKLNIDNSSYFPIEIIKGSLLQIANVEGNSVTREYSYAKDKGLKKLNNGTSSDVIFMSDYEITNLNSFIKYKIIDKALPYHCQ